MSKQIKFTQKESSENRFLAQEMLSLIEHNKAMEMGHDEVFEFLEEELGWPIEYIALLRKKLKYSIENPF